MFGGDLPVTGENMIAGLKTTRPDIYYLVPYTLKLMMETDGGIEAMRMCRSVCYSGSACPEELGNKVTAAGVVLSSYYGS